ncbi:MAG: GNAT family N-acetyltransferase [Asgard group archaeon]|nr:GNAT family N-acetyltransferase [Asgard group archaeon]
MSEITFIQGSKINIPAKYLEQLFQLMQKNHHEILKDDPPEIEFFRLNWAISEPEESKRIYTLAIDKNDKLLGYGYFSYNIKYDNLDQGYFWIYVAKEHRRKKIGTKILLKVLEDLPPQITKISTEIFEDTDGKYFVGKLKEKKNYQEVISKSDLTKFNADEVKKEAEKQRKLALEKGYDIIYFENNGAIFYFNLEQYVKMVEKIWNDMPREELSYEDDVLTPERYQIMQQRNLLMGDRIMTFVAVHKETGSPIGLTCSIVNKYIPGIVLQEDTGILKDHRGNGLGLALKYQMLNKLLQEKLGKFWRTGNAGSNEYMLRINRILQHKPAFTIDIYEFTREELLEKINQL